MQSPFCASLAAAASSLLWRVKEPRSLGLAGAAARSDKRKSQLGAFAWVSAIHCVILFDGECPPFCPVAMIYDTLFYTPLAPSADMFTTTTTSGRESRVESRGIQSDGRSYRRNISVHAQCVGSSYTGRALPLHAVKRFTRRSLP